MEVIAIAFTASIVESSAVSSATVIIPSWFQILTRALIEILITVTRLVYSCLGGEVTTHGITLISGLKVIVITLAATENERPTFPFLFIVVEPEVLSIAGSRLLGLLADSPISARWQQWSSTHPLAVFCRLKVVGIALTTAIIEGLAAAFFPIKVPSSKGCSTWTDHFWQGTDIDCFLSSRFFSRRCDNSRHGCSGRGSSLQDTRVLAFIMRSKAVSVTITTTVEEATTCASVGLKVPYSSVVVTWSRVLSY